MSSLSYDGRTSVPKLCAAKIFKGDYLQPGGLATIGPLGAVVEVTTRPYLLDGEDNPFRKVVDVRTIPGRSWSVVDRVACFLLVPLTHDRYDSNMEALGTQLDAMWEYVGGLKLDEYAAWLETTDGADDED